jgi:putative membrane protein
MSSLSQLAALVGALAYLGAAPFEMVLFGRPATMRFLHVETDHVEDVRMWAFCIGARNALAGAGTIAGLVILHSGDATVGRAVVITCVAYMRLASLAMGVADALGYWRPRGGSVLGTVASSAPPLVALVAATL